MKIPTLLSTSALALLVSMSISYGSDAVEAPIEDVTVTPTPAPVEEAKSYAIWDLDENGEFGVGDVLVGAKKFANVFFDFTGDGKFDGEDVNVLLGRVISLFLGDKGQEEFEAIVQTNTEALGTNAGLSDRVLSLSSTIVESTYFAGIPEDLKKPLSTLLGIVGQAATDTQAGKNIGGAYTASIKAALEGINKNIKHLTDGGMSAEETTQSRKDIFAYLEMVKGWYNTGDNAKPVNKIEEKLNKIKVPTDDTK